MGIFLILIKMLCTPASVDGVYHMYESSVIVICGFSLLADVLLQHEEHLPPLRGRK